jgi:hypothetical protein
MHYSRRTFARIAALSFLALPRLAQSGHAALAAGGTILPPKSGRLRPTARDLYRAHPGVEIAPLASRYHHCIHSYPGIEPYDRAGRRLLYAGFESPPQADIVIRDLRTGVEQAVATSNSTDYHTAAWQRWALDDTMVIFEQRDADGARQTWWVPSDGSVAAEPLSYLGGFSLRHVLGGGAIAYGSGTKPGGHAQVVRVDLARRSKEVVCDIRDLVSKLPADLKQDGLGYHFSHPVPDDREAWMFVKVMGQASGSRGSRFVAFFTVHLGSGRVVCHGSGISGHPIWDPVTGHIFNIRKPGPDAPSLTRELVLMDPDSTAMTEFVNDLIEGPGHPAPSPDGRWLATDAFWQGRETMIYLYDRSSPARWTLAMMPHTWSAQTVYDPSVVSRGQPHPVWAPDSRSLLINCNLGKNRYILHTIRGFADKSVRV